MAYIHPLLQSKWLTANNYNRNSNPERLAYFEKLIEFHQLLVRAFHDAGVPLLAGTDSGVSGVIAGFALHDELELLQQAGLSPQEVLATATCLPAEWLRIDKQTGSIETGKYADLLLLDADPLIDIRNTRAIAGVFVSGKYLPAIRLKAMTTKLALWNADHKDRYDWKTVISK